MLPKNTGFKDQYGNVLMIGDFVYSSDGYDLQIKGSESGYYGRLICEKGHSCENIPYCLNGGEWLVKFPSPFVKQMLRGKLSRNMKRQYEENTGKKFNRLAWVTYACET
jgi:hypothetical protein